MRKCRNCNQLKHETEFNRIHSTYRTPHGDTIEYTHFRKDCKPCHAKKKYDRMLQTKYNLSKKEYLKRLKESNNQCAICHKEFSGREPYVDHNHTTGSARGLLCETCNFGIGHFKDNVELLENAIDYLKAWLQVVPEGDSCN